MVYSRYAEPGPREDQGTGPEHGTERGPGNRTRTMGNNRFQPLSWFRCNVKVSIQFHTTYSFVVPLPVSHPPATTLTCPVPQCPVCTTFFPICLRTGSALLYPSAEPPTMNVRIASLAAFTPATNTQRCVHVDAWRLRHIERLRFLCYSNEVSINVFRVKLRSY